MKRAVFSSLAIGLLTVSAIAFPLFAPISWVNSAIGAYLFTDSDTAKPKTPDEKAAPEAALSITTLGVPLTENFDTLASTGTTNMSVPNGWAFLETGTAANTTYAAGTGSSTTGNTYSFGAASATDRAFGGLLSGSLVPTIGASYTNNTGSPITSLDIAYTGEEWRCGNNGSGADRLDFQYSLDATDLATGAWTDVDALDFSTPNICGTGILDGNLALNRTAVSSTITGLNIPNGATFWIRWNDFDRVPNSDDGLAVDDFSITANGSVNTPPVAVDDNVSATQDTPLMIPAGDLLANDVDPDAGQTLTVTAVNNAVNGSVSLAAGVITFTPGPGFAGPAAFDYVVSDGLASDVGIVNVTVLPANNGQFNFNPQFYSPNELDGSVTLTVTRTGGTDGAVTVDYGVVAAGLNIKRPNGVIASATGGAACLSGSGVDYVTPSGTLNFADGDSSKPINVTICDDQLFELTENFAVTLSNATGGATIGTTSAGSVNILDDDTQPSLQFSAANFDVNENGGTATVTVTRTGATEHVLSVNYSAVTGGSAAAGTCGAFSGNDFEPTSGTLNFAAGDNSETFDITICNDGLFEASNETILIALNTQSAPALLGTPNSGTVTIIPNNDAPSVEFSTAASSVGEGAGTKTFTVNRTGATENSFSVDFATANGTAVNGACVSGGDYVSNNGTLTFVGGDPNKTFDVTICEDSTFEGDEDFSASLSNPTGGAVIGTNSTETVTITDNDTARTYVVDNLSDDIGLNACTDDPNDCSLRGATSVAQSGETITFALTPALGPTASVITLGGSEIAVTTDITITGPGADQLAIDAGGTSRVISFNGVTANLSGLTLSGGNAVGANFSGSGGALLSVNGSVTLDGLRVTGNTAPIGAGGAALFGGSGHVVRNSTFDGNTVTGGIGAACGGLEVTGDASLTNLTISGNSATGQGGGLCMFASGVLRNSTITSNNSDQEGGGLYAGGVATFDIGSTIITGNTAPTHPEVGIASGSPVSSGFNLIGDSAGEAGDTGTSIAYQTTDIQDTDPLLGPLQNNGGPTFTHGFDIALGVSPAIDQGSAFGLTTDQRGFGRTVDYLSVANPVGGDGTDIGAFEFLAPTAASASISGKISTASGQGIRSVLVIASGGDLAQPVSVVTGTFGNFKIDGLHAGETYVVSVRAKKYVFTTPDRVVQLTDSISDLDFVASP